MSEHLLGPEIKQTSLVCAYCAHQQAVLIRTKYEALTVSSSPGSWFHAGLDCDHELRRCRFELKDLSE